MRRTMMVVLLAAAVACRSSQPQAPDAVDQQQTQSAVDDTLRLALGESGRVLPAGLLVSFDSVLADSRCPRGVQCVWAGSARVRLTIGENAGAASRHELESGQEPRSTRVGAWVVTLLAVAPDAEQGRAIGRGYRITLRVSAP